MALYENVVDPHRGIARRVRVARIPVAGPVSVRIARRHKETYDGRVLRVVEIAREDRNCAAFVPKLPYEPTRLGEPHVRIRAVVEMDGRKDYLAARNLSFHQRGRFAEAQVRARPADG